MSRLLPHEPADLDRDQRALYDTIAGGPRAAGPQLFALTDADGHLNGPFDAMLLAPPIGTALQQVGAAIRYESTLSARVREMAILAVAVHWDCAFERYAHEPIGQAVGLSATEIAALVDGQVPTLSDPAESAALELVSALLRDGDIADPDYDRVTAAVGARTVFELSTLVGYYATLALQLRLFRVGVPSPS